MATKKAKKKAPAKAKAKAKAKAPAKKKAPAKIKAAAKSKKMLVDFESSPIFETIREESVELNVVIPCPELHWPAAT